MNGRFKPYYNWNTFNTFDVQLSYEIGTKVLNLIITGMPSIPGHIGSGTPATAGFKPYYNWNAFNTRISTR